MTPETVNALLIFVGAVIVAVLYILDRTNKRVADSVPPQALAILEVAVTALQTLAEKTPTTLDDDVVGLLRLLLASTPPPATPATPSEPPAGT